KDFENWVYCYFERIGQLIVLDSGEGPQLPFRGELFANDEAQTPAGTVRKDGIIVDLTGALLGQVTLTTGSFRQRTDQDSARVVDQSGKLIGYVSTDDAKTLQNGAAVAVAGPVVWQQAAFNDASFSIGIPGNALGYIRSH